MAVFVRVCNQPDMQVAGGSTFMSLLQLKGNASRTATLPEVRMHVTAQQLYMPAAVPGRNVNPMHGDGVT